MTSGSEAPGSCAAGTFALHLRFAEGRDRRHTLGSLAVNARPVERPLRRG